MDASEATRVVMSRIQSLDPENATKIMGVILIRDDGEKAMIRLAHSSDAILLSYINQLKFCFRIKSSGHTTDASNFVRPKNPVSLSSQILTPRDGYHLSNPSSPSSVFPRIGQRPVSYASVVNGSSASGSTTSCANDLSGSSSFALCGDEFGEELLQRVHDQSILDDSKVYAANSPSGRSDSMVIPYGEDFNSGITSPHSNPFHRRSYSVNDASFHANSEEGGARSGFMWTPCTYFARGFCKNGSSCKFLHSVVNGVEGMEVGSPCKNFSGVDEFLRMKAIQQRKFELMASGGQYPYGYSKRVNVLNENQRSAVSALMMGDDFQKVNCYRPERNDLFTMGLNPGANSSSRQIYLTFPADSTFKEEDVSNYFSNFGPVQDVRIPYQQKRMFGFVTFAFSETVKLILAKGNPHFVCDSRVLVKPYKEKGAIPANKHYHHTELGEYAVSSSPELDLREHLDIPFGPRMLLNSQGMMLRRKMEHDTELQHAVELQGRRMMNLHVMDKANQPQMHNIPLISPLTRSQSSINPNLIISPNAVDQEVSGDDNGGQEAATSQAVRADDLKLAEGTEFGSNKNLQGANKQAYEGEDYWDTCKSLESALPDNLFASPTKSAAENRTLSFAASAESSKFGSL